MRTSFGIVSILILLSSLIGKQVAYSQTVPEETTVNEVVKVALVHDSLPVLGLERSNYQVLDVFTKTRYNDFYTNEMARKQYGLTQGDKTYLDKQQAELQSIDREVFESLKFITQDSIKQLIAYTDKENKNGGNSRSGVIYYTIGKPVFTPDGKKAFITISQICHNLLCGESWTLLLKQEKGQWKVADRKESLVKI